MLMFFTLFYHVGESLSRPDLTTNSFILLSNQNATDALLEMSNRRVR